MQAFVDIPKTIFTDISLITLLSYSYIFRFMFDSVRHNFQILQNCLVLFTCDDVTIVTSSFTFITLLYSPSLNHLIYSSYLSPRKKVGLSTFFGIR